MAFGKNRYNAYRKRSFNMSDSKRKEYAQAMDELEQAFDELDGWILSSKMDSAYKNFDNYEVRLSNHSADNQYHDLENGRLIVNVRASKLNFLSVIQSQLDEILAKVDKLPLSDYRFINVNLANKSISCFYKGYKTKKDVIDF
ncbi:hypothetical protein HRE60_10740 (plasmid) [Streptococcus salivarius]|jgi:hypothetical protein|uniref:Uncharacterized protein n=1 Tax=Streptococcus salivarius TaxID=1304 RepID=A0A7L6WNA3_STRSL|nr:hypothetical protein [Streptococcus salivarius]QMI52153.1 hypothetical protein HRE60_10740 [Streptococcus salivarius]